MKLSELLDISMGKTPARKEKRYWGKGHKWVSIRDLNEKVITKTKEEITDSAVDETRIKLVTKGTLLFSFKLTIGKMAFAGTDLYTNEAIAAFVIKDPKKLDSSYLYYALKTARLLGSNQAAMGKTLNSKSLAAIEIPIPDDINDQKRIAHLLDSVEALIIVRKQSIQQLDDLVKSIFLDMFSPLSKGYEKWPLKEIKDLAATHKRAMRTGPFGSNLKHDEFTPDGKVAVLGIDNAVQNKFAWSEKRFITEKKYQELKSYTIFPGDVIVTIMGTIGRSAVIPEDIPLAINTKHLAAITLDVELANPTFISYSIHSSPYILNQFKSKNRGAIMSGLNLGIIKETKIKLPPIDVQRAFSEIHSKIENIKAKYQNSLDDLETLYGALSQKAFKGELDLSLVPLPSEKEDHTDNISSDELMKTPVSSTENSIRLLSPFDAKILTAHELRKAQLSKWFNEWLEHYQKESDLDISLFWQSVSFTTQDCLDENDNPFEVGLSDYDHIKSEIFDAIKNGSIEQTTDMIEVEVDGKSTIEPGNKILLKKLN
ncbi:restriction endonuclease subunit S [Shewanella sp. 30m-9]